MTVGQIADVLRKLGDEIAPDDTMGKSRMAHIRLVFHEAMQKPISGEPNFDGAWFLRNAQSDGWVYAARIDTMRGDTVFSDTQVERGNLKRHRAEIDPWQTHPADKDYLPEDKRWCRVCLRHPSHRCHAV